MPRKPTGQARERWHRFTVDAGEDQLIQAALAAQQTTRPGLKMMGYLREVVLAAAERDAAGAHDALRRYAESRGVDAVALFLRILQDPDAQQQLAPALVEILERGVTPKKS